MPLRLLFACLCACVLVTLAIAAPGARATVPLNYVALGDSLAALPGYVDNNAADMDADLDANVTVTNLGVSGWTSNDLRGAVESNRIFRASLASADVVTLDIGINDLLIARVHYLMGTCGGADQQDCLRAAQSSFRANWDGIMAQLRSLTAVRSAVIRPMDIYDPYIALDTQAGYADVLSPYWQAANAHIAASALSTGMPLADVAAAFNGSDGGEDPVAKGYIAADGLHLTAAGASAVSALFRANGYADVDRDTDQDTVADRVDNCPAVGNPGQANADADRVDLDAYGKVFDDLTWPNSDGLGDACDADDDNDGLTDVAEVALASGGCPAATAATDPLKRDTDGDGTMDAAECVLLSDPANTASRPVPGIDTDRDGLYDGMEILVGTDPLSADTDRDGVLDGTEVRRYGSNPLRADTDGDGCSDRVEVASINADRTVNAGDISQLFRAFGPSTSSNYVAYFDSNGDATMNSIDLMLAAQSFGGCP